MLSVSYGFGATFAIAGVFMLLGGYMFKLLPKI